MQLTRNALYYQNHKEEFKAYAKKRRSLPSRKTAETTMARIRMWMGTKPFEKDCWPMPSPNPNRRAEPLGEILGCTAKEFKAWIESQFAEGMQWTPRNWHLGHRVPVRLFDCSDLKQLRACFNYKNLQPEVPLDNQRRINEDLLPER